VPPGPSLKPPLLVFSSAWHWWLISSTRMWQLVLIGLLIVSVSGYLVN